MPTPMIIEGLPLAAQQSDRASVYTLSSGKTFAIPHVPDVGQEMHMAAKPIRDAGKALAALEQARQRAKDDRNLSDIGRAKVTDPARAAALAAIQEAAADLDELRHAAAVLERQVFGPPVLEPTDAVAAIVDREIRDYLRALPPGDRAASIKELGGSSAMLAAVLRSPIPLPVFSDYAAKLWREVQAVAHPKAAELSGRQSALAWAESTLPALKAQV